jgi:hypothetical protein
MSKTLATCLIIIGFVVAAIDAWLSIQSTIGLMSPQNAIGWAAAIVVGIAMTVLAVMTPILKDQSLGLFWKAVWIVMTIGDIVTSIIGTIWYGALSHPITESVKFDELSFDFGNTLTTLLHVAFVVLLFLACLALGKALDAFR